MILYFYCIMQKVVCQVVCCEIKISKLGNVSVHFFKMTAGYRDLLGKFLPKTLIENLIRVSGIFP